MSHTSTHERLASFCLVVGSSVTPTEEEPWARELLCTLLRARPQMGLMHATFHPGSKKTAGGDARTYHLALLSTRQLSSSQFPHASVIIARQLPTPVVQPLSATRGERPHNLQQLHTKLVIYRSSGQLLGLPVLLLVVEAPRPPAGEYSVTARLGFLGFLGKATLNGCSSAV